MLFRSGESLVSPLYYKSLLLSTEVGGENMLLPTRADCESMLLLTGVDGMRSSYDRGSQREQALATRLTIWEER